MHISPTPSRFDAQRYWEKRLSSASEFADVGYAGLGEPFNAWMYRVRRRVFKHAVAPYVHSIRSVLDIGSGSGFYVDRWRELGVTNVRGCDLVAAAVDRLRNSYPASEFMQLDIGGPADDLPPWRVDAISAFDVTFHIVDDARFKRAFRNMFTLLEPGGILAFSDNFVAGPSQRADHHVSRTQHEIGRAVHDAGFEVVSQRPSFVLMNEPVDRPPWLHARGWSLLARVLRRFPVAGHVLGACLYPPELAAVRLASKGPSTKVMLCRRPTDAS